MSLANVNKAARPPTTTTTTIPFLQSPTARTIVPISIMSVVLLVSNHVLDGTAHPPIQTLSYESFLGFFFLFCNSSPHWRKKKKPPLNPTRFPSFFSSHTRLLTPTPFLSALFKSKQKTHLVCLLAPSLSLTYFHSVEHPSFFLLWNFFFNCFYQSWGQHFTGAKSWERKTGTRLTFVAVIHNFMDTILSDFIILKAMSFRKYET